MLEPITSHNQYQVYCTNNNARNSVIGTLSFFFITGQLPCIQLVSEPKLLYLLQTRMVIFYSQASFTVAIVKNYE